MRSEYQVFISFKNSNDKTGEETPDKEIAQKVYKYLSDRGLNVFFSPITLKALGRDSWEEEIHLALKESKVFIALGTNQENMNAHHVKKERDFFGGLKLVDESRAIYGYIASPMSLKDIPDDISKKEVFQDKKSDALISLYTYIRNHLARDFRGEFNKKPKANSSYLWIGLLLLVGILFFNMSNHDNGLVEIVKEEIEKKEVVIKEQKIEIEEKEEEHKKDKRIILAQSKKLEIVNQAIKELEKDFPIVATKLKKKLKFEGVEIAYGYFLSIDWSSYRKKIKNKKDLNGTKDSNQTKDNINQKLELININEDYLIANAEYIEPTCEEVKRNLKELSITELKNRIANFKNYLVIENKYHNTAGIYSFFINKKIKIKIKIVNINYLFMDYLEYKESELFNKCIQTKQVQLYHIAFILIFNECDFNPEITLKLAKYISNYSEDKYIGTRTIKKFVDSLKELPQDNWTDFIQSIENSFEKLEEMNKEANKKLVNPLIDEGVTLKILEDMILGKKSK